MAELDIRIRVGAFCPQLALPCVDGAAYPDPTSCSHFYYCTDQGEVTRFSCAESLTNNKVRIIKGAALCVRASRSTCRDSNPRRQCEALDGFLPDEYCEVEAPSRTIWTYPDPARCAGYYVYRPPAAQHTGLVVEHRFCPAQHVYSPGKMTCVPEGGSQRTLCGGKWVRHNDECRNVKAPIGWGMSTRGHHSSTSVPSRPANSSRSTVSPLHTGPYAIPLVPVLLGVLAALIFLTVTATVLYVIYQKRGNKRLGRDSQPAEPDGAESGVGEMAHRASCVEFNEYAAIDEVFGSSLERPQADGRTCCPPAEEDLAPAPPLRHRSVPDGYGAPDLPFRPKSQPITSNSRLHSDSALPAIPLKTKVSDIQRRGLEKGSKIQCDNEGPREKECFNVNWFQALSATDPIVSESSSDEYETMEYHPVAGRGASCRSDGPRDSCSHQPCDDEYMIPIVSSARNSTRKKKTSNTSTAKPVIPLRAKRRAGSLRNTLPSKKPGDLPKLSTSIRPNSDITLCSQGQHNDPDDNAPENKILFAAVHVLECDDSGYGQLKNCPALENDRGEGNWEVSDSWARVKHPVKSKRIKRTTSQKGDRAVFYSSGNSERLDISQNSETLEHPACDTSSHVDSNIFSWAEGGHASRDNGGLPHSDTPDFSFAGEIETSSNVDSDIIISVGDGKGSCDEITMEVSATPEEENATKGDNSGSDGSRRRGYEILVTATPTADIRVYQRISVGSQDSAEDKGDTCAIGGETPTGTAKNHEYYVLDKHHSSEETVRMLRSPRVLSTRDLKQNYRQSCNF